jgi:PAS domain S-box-containing protein
MLMDRTSDDLKNSATNGQPCVTSSPASALVAAPLNDREASDARLVASELRYRRLFETAKDGILIIDATTGMVEDVNPYLMERLGFSKDQFLGKRIWDLGCFRDIIGNQENFAELQRNEYIRYEDKPLETADGRLIDVEFVSNLYQVAGLDVIQCNIRDITERKLVERQLREQSEILSKTHEGVMIVNLGNGVSLWNGAAASLFGWTAEEAKRHTPEVLLGVDDPTALRMMYERVDRDEFWTGEISCQARDGRKLTIEFRVTLVRDQAGKARARLHFLADVTEKKLIEKRFLRMQRLEAIGTLSSGIAHDLNNILAPVLMASGMLRERSADPHSDELLLLIENSVQRGAEIIRQLLPYSRGIEGERNNLQVHHLIRDVAVIVRETFPRNIRLKLETAPDLWPIAADATQLHQVLLNLCVNSRDAMPEGGTLKITAANIRLSKADSPIGPTPQDGPHILLTISDTGLGIARENIDRIFEPFFTTKAIGAGTGLGLSTVLGIVRSHGGTVVASSDPGRGASFKILLPANPGSQVKKTQDTATAPTTGHGEIILVVDDEESIRTAARLCLESAGYRVLTAADGPAAIAIFTEHKSDVRVVLTDVMMPEMDGLRLARELRDIDPTVRVIACSGLDPVAAPEALATGIIVEFLRKPYDRQLLCTAIARHL